MAHHLNRLCEGPLNERPQASFYAKIRTNSYITIQEASGNMYCSKVLHNIAKSCSFQRIHVICTVKYMLIMKLTTNGVHKMSEWITVKILKFGTPQTIAIIVLKIEKFDVTLH